MNVTVVRVVDFRRVSRTFKFVANRTVIAELHKTSLPRDTDKRDDEETEKSTNESRKYN